MQPEDFVERQRVLAGLQHRAAPPLQPVARRALALDLEARAAVGQQHEARRARDQMGAGAADGFARLGGEIQADEFGQRRCAPDDRAKASGAQQIVADAVAAGEARLAREIRVRVEHDRLPRAGGSVVNGERAPGQVLIQIPRSPRRVARRRGADHRLDASAPARRRRRLKIRRSISS